MAKDNLTELDTSDNSVKSQTFYSHPRIAGVLPGSELIFGKSEPMLKSWTLTV